MDYPFESFCITAESGLKFDELERISDGTNYQLYEPPI